MKHLKIKIENLLDNKLTFLVGAGCSANIPSCLPTGNEMIQAIIENACIDDEVPNLKTLEGLRFELLIDIIRNTIDPNLSIFDYFSICDKPNTFHFFLAEMIKEGHFVMTTNFDYLLELSLLQSNVPQEEIIPVITKSDFENFDNPQKLFKNGKKTVYKIHGSTKNIITNEETRQSLIATIEALGKNKEGISIFQIEPFKHELFKNITYDRNLILIGYSGTDDFDIIPSLKILRKIKNLVWINFKPELGANEKIFEIQENTNYSSQESMRIIDLLCDIKKSNCAERVFLVEGDTALLIKRLVKKLEISPDIKNESFGIPLSNWIRNNFRQIGEIDKNHITAKIYHHLCSYSEAVRILEKIRFLILNKMPFNQYKLSSINNEIGSIYTQQGKYQEALNSLELALRNCSDWELKASIYNNIGQIKFNLNEYEESLKFYEATLEIDKILDNIENQGTSLNNIGTIYDKQGEFNNALKYYKKALDISYSTNMWSRATRLNNVANIYSKQGNYDEALGYYREALSIADKLGDLARKSTLLDNIGTIYFRQHDYSTALKYFLKALLVARRINYLFEEVAALFNIGHVYFVKGDNKESLTHLENAAVIAEKLDSPEWKAVIYSRIEIIKKGGTFELKSKEELEQMKQHDKCYVPVEEIEKKHISAQKTLRKLEKEDSHDGNPENQIKKLTEMGHAYLDSHQLNKALTAYNKAYEISYSINDEDTIATSMANIGNVYIEMNELEKASEFISRAHKLYSKIENYAGMARQIGNMGVIYIRDNNPKEALKSFQKAYDMFKDSGNYPEEENLFYNHIKNVKRLYNVK